MIHPDSRFYITTMFNRAPAYSMRLHPSFCRLDYSCAPDISKDVNQAHWNMRNVKAWRRVEAGTDDQILSLSGCQVTEVSCERTCEKTDRIPQENLQCHSTWKSKEGLDSVLIRPCGKQVES